MTKNRENEGDLVIPGSNVILKVLILWLNMEEVNLFSFNKKTN